MTSALNKYNNLTQRIIAGSIGAGLIVSSIWINEWTFFAVFLIITALSVLEFYKLVGIDGMIPLKTFGTFSGLFVYTLVFLIERNTLSDKFYFLIFPLLSGIYLIKLYKKTDKKPFTNIAMTFLGILYITLPLSLLNILAYFHGVYNHEIILGVLLLSWANDSGAYFAGSKFGKRKLFERVSPKKTWEGFLGGLVIAILIALVLAHYFQSINITQWIVISFIIVISGTYGDLVESLFKRSIEIKDSGSSIPGHGGFLDRFDGFFLSLPFIVAYLEVF